MISGQEHLLEAMIEAFVMEKGTCGFYAKALQTAKSAREKEAFQTLLKWEEAHMAYIQFLYQSILEQREPLSFESFSKSVKPTELEGGINVADLEKRLEDYIPKNGQDALDLAMELEGKAYNLYRKIASEAEDTNTKAFMEDMMSWENEHLKFLKKVKSELA